MNAPKRGLEKTALRTETTAPLPPATPVSYAPITLHQKQEFNVGIAQPEQQVGCQSYLVAPVTQPGYHVENLLAAIPVNLLQETNLNTTRRTLLQTKSNVQVFRMQMQHSILKVPGAVSYLYSLSVTFIMSKTAT